MTLVPRNENAASTSFSSAPRGSGGARGSCAARSVLSSTRSRAIRRRRRICRRDCARVTKSGRYHVVFILKCRRKTRFSFPASSLLNPSFELRGPNEGTGTSSDHESALMKVLWWHTQQHTSSDRTPLGRMLPSVIGSIDSFKRLVAIRQL
jgi:hypothetical protein